MARQVDTIPITVNADGSISTRSVTVTQTALTYSAGLLVSYIEGGVTWTITRDAAGNPTSITSA